VTKISAVVPDEYVRSLEAQARAEDRSVSSVIRRAIAEHLTSPSGSRGARDESAVTTMAAGSTVQQQEP